MRGTPSEVNQEVLDAICRQNLEAYASKAIDILEPSCNFEYNWHIGCICDHLEAVYRGDIPQLIINMPPRMLKTLLASISFPSWVLGKNPSEKIMLTSFRSGLAEKMTRKTRALMKKEWYQRVFDTRISEELDRQYYFETTGGGQYFSSSMSSVTGEGATLQILDDPLNPDEALSDTIRLSTIETIRGTLFSRFNDPRKAKFVMIMQRLHDADPTGELLKDGGWHLLKLPAEAVDKTYHISLGKKEWTLKQGELLFPSRFTREVLDNARTRLMDYNYAGQYLQEPVPIGGGEFKPNWIQYYSQGAIKPKEMNVYIMVDPSAGEESNRKRKKLSDWTAFMVVGLAPDNNMYLLEVVRDRLNPTERIETLFMLHRKWNAVCGKPPKVGYEKYGMMTDTHYIELKKREDAYHFPLIELGGSQSKEDRIRRLIPDMNMGRWYFPNAMDYIDNEGRRFDLVKEIIDSEMATFPRSRHDDCLDALSRIYDMDMVFPRPKQNMVEKAIKASYNANRGSTSWEDF